MGMSNEEKIKTLKEVITILEEADKPAPSDKVNKIQFQNNKMIFIYENGNREKHPEGSSVGRLEDANLGNRIELNPLGANTSHIGFTINELIYQGYTIDRQKYCNEIIFRK